MTHVLGPAIAAEGAPAKAPRPLKQLSITRDLIAQLPKASHVWFRLHGGITNTLAFDISGFSNNVGFTVEIRPNLPDLLWRQMRDKTRNVIRRAQERLTVSEVLDAAQFLDFYEDNLREKGLRNVYDRGICNRIISACLDPKVGRVLATIDQQGQMQSAIFTVWDLQAEYYFLSTRKANSINGATSLSIWTAIQHASVAGLIFDMDGLHVQGDQLPNLHLLTGFGGTIMPRYVVHRTSSIIRLAQHAKAYLSKCLQSAT